MKKKRIFRGLKIAAFAAIAAAVFGGIVMQLWNWLIPDLFGGHAIGFWQALGLIVLSKILFGGFRGGPGFGRHWRGRMAERWERMTPEQREKFAKGMRGGCGPFESGAEPQVP